MGDISQIGSNIRFYREKLGITQRALAESVLVSFQAISAWERGMSIPDLENVVRLAECFGVTVDALLTGVARELFVGIDGNGNRTEFVLFEKDGTVRNIVCLGGANPNDQGLDACLEVLHNGLEQLLAGRIPHAVFAGIAGASIEDHRVAISAQVRDRFRTKAEVDSDAANVLSCAVNPENAMAIICGTGSCVFVRKGESCYRLGGWGYLLDQAGSAYDVGRDGIHCALAAKDGLREKTLMTRRITQMLGGDPYIGIPVIYKKGRPFIAEFAPVVVEAAQKGDKAALQILRNNAQRLAEIIKTAIRRFGAPEEFVASGFFLEHALFRDLVENAAGIRLTIPDVPPVYGACVEALRVERIPVTENFHQNFMESYRRVSC